jgi:hypothetical protein
VYHLRVAENFKTAHTGYIGMIAAKSNKLKSTKDKNVAINRKYMPIDFAINVMHTAKYRKYMHIEMVSS